MVVSRKHQIHLVCFVASLMLALLLTFGISTKVMADPGQETDPAIELEEVDYSDPDNKDLPEYVYTYLIEQIREFNPCIDFTKYHILLSKNGDEEYANFVVSYLHAFLKQDYPITCAANCVGQEYEYEGDKIYLKSISYVYEDFDIQKLDEEIDKVWAILEPDMTDLAKVVAIHDYLAAHTTYDTHNLVQGTDGRADHSMYGCLVDRKCVCEGYAEAFQYFMDELGIECYYVSGPVCSHMWNKVILDGEAYNVDVTDDCCVRGEACFIHHRSLLVPDSRTREPEDAFILKHGPRDNIPATSEKYMDDHAFWSELNCPIVLHNGCYYFMNPGDKENTCALRYLEYGKETEEAGQILSDEIGVWYGLDGDEKKQSKWSGNIVYFRDGRIYFNTPNGVSSMTEQGEDLKEEYVVKLPIMMEVYGVIERDGQLVYHMKYEVQGTSTNEIEEHIFTEKDRPGQEDPVPETENPIHDHTVVTEPSETVEPSETKKVKAEKTAKVSDSNIKTIVIVVSSVLVVGCIVAVVILVKVSKKEKKQQQ